MVANERDILSILANAIDMEFEGMEYFEEVASGAKHQRTRDTFASLVKQERRHADILREELRRLSEGKVWASLEEMKTWSGDSAKPSVFHDKQIRRMKFNPEAGELEALRLGMEIERKSVDYYRNAGANALDSKAIAIFNWLVGEEAGHLTVLNAEYEYRIRSGFYYDNMEFSLEVM